MANNTIIKFNQIVSDIKNRQFSPVYLLEGEETYFIDALTDVLETSVLKEEEKSFDQMVIYGKDAKALDIKMAAKRFPLMSQYLLIIVKEAQNLDDIDAFEDYLLAPPKSTILVFCYKGKKVDKRKKAGKLFSKYIHFTSERMRDYEVTPWVEKYIRDKGKSIEPNATQLIVDYLGSDLGKISSEIDKMFINLKPEIGLIAMTHIEQNIGISKDYNIFELQKALGDKNFNKSIQIANYFAQNIKNHPLIPTIANLLGFFTKVYLYNSVKNKSKKEIAIVLGVNEFFVDSYRIACGNYPPVLVEQIFGYLKFYDLRAKGINDSGLTEDGQLLIEMVLKILRVAEVPVQLRPHA
ncbi:MAG: DNA polymerase III subunit delta [Bacteroidota bacterium]